MNNYSWVTISLKFPFLLSNTKGNGKGNGPNYRMNSANGISLWLHKLKYDIRSTIDQFGGINN